MKVSKNYRGPSLASPSTLDPFLSEAGLFLENVSVGTARDEGGRACFGIVFVGSRLFLQVLLPSTTPSTPTPQNAAGRMLCSETCQTLLGLPKLGVPYFFCKGVLLFGV